MSSYPPEVFKYILEKIDQESLTDYSHEVYLSIDIHIGQLENKTKQTVKMKDHNLMIDSPVTSH